MKAKHEKPKKKKKFFNGTFFIFLVLVAVFIYSTYNVVMWLISNHNTEKLETEVFSKVVVENIEEKKLDVDFEKLEEINSDIIGWIKIENTNINYPILQGKTDEKYLRRDIYGKYNFSGSIFVDSTTKTDFSDDNTVIYGHNLRNQKMFSQLKRIYDGELGTDIDVEIYTKNEQKIYKVFSAYLSEQNLELTKKNFAEGEKEKFINNAIKKSKMQFKADINDKENVLTLITCDKSGEKRYVINAII